jgi:hypothetical protein
MQCHDNKDNFFLLGISFHLNIVLFYSLKDGIKVISNRDIYYKEFGFYILNLKQYYPIRIL